MYDIILVLVQILSYTFSTYTIVVDAREYRKEVVKHMFWSHRNVAARLRGVLPLGTPDRNGRSVFNSIRRGNTNNIYFACYNRSSSRLYESSKSSTTTVSHGVTIVVQQSEAVKSPSSNERYSLLYCCLYDFPYAPQPPPPYSASRCFFVAAAVSWFHL